MFDNTDDDWKFVVTPLLPLATAASLQSKFIFILEVACKDETLRKLRRDFKFLQLF